MITSYDGLDLGRYMKIDKVLHTPQEEIDKQVQIVAILADMSEDEVLHLPLADYTAMALKTAFLGKECTPLEISGIPVAVGGMLLDLTNDFTKITTAQYVDFQTYVKDFPSTLPELLSCFMIPYGKTYNEGYDMAKVQNAIRQLTLPMAMGLVGFFFVRFSTSITDSLTSLAQMSKKNPQKMERLAKLTKELEATLQAAGVGLPM